MQNLGDLLSGVVGKKEHEPKRLGTHDYGYNKCIDEISSLSVCIDERKIEKVLQKKFDEAQEQVFDGMDMVGKVEFSELAKAISQSNNILKIERKDDDTKS